MSDLLLANEGSIRLTVFIAVLALMAILEGLSPRRRRDIPRFFRWSNNVALVVVDSLVVNLCFPLLAVAFAVLMTEQGWGLFNLITLPGWLAFVLAILLLDFAIYIQHVVFHRVPILWRLHRVHHTDLECDVTTALRFHPIEILLSMLIKLFIVFLLGPAAIAVLVFEIILNASAMFNHSNLRLPLLLDKRLRLLLVTPDMHRVHHSVHVVETNSNYGFFIPWWDRLFGTYCEQPKDGHEAMRIGINEFRDVRQTQLHKLLLQPLRTGD